MFSNLGEKIRQSLDKLRDTLTVDTSIINEIIKDVGNALVGADVNVKIILGLRERLKSKLDLSKMAAGIDKRKLITQTVFKEICDIFSTSDKTWCPMKGKQHVVMIVGLEGSGKTTTLCKLANYYKKKGYKAGIVCADTFRAGAYDQVIQNCAQIKVSYYVNRNERDPVKVAKEGVEEFKCKGFDMILVDTSGRHKGSEELFEEMAQIKTQIRPDCVLLVIDATIGQSAMDQAMAFQKYVDIGSIIITKLDSGAKGGGAISAVIATKANVSFICTGERMSEIEAFNVETFVSRLMGIGDFKHMLTMLREEVKPEENPEIGERLRAGKFTLNDMYVQLEKMATLDNFDMYVSMLPQEMQKDSKDEKKMAKIYLHILDSMTTQELDNPKILNASRVNRIARGSGRKVSDVNDLLKQYKSFERMMLAMRSQMNRLRK